jgi:DNA repair protein RadA/Sms
MNTAKKVRTLFVCQSCGQQTPKWLGRCPGCMAWSSLVEEVAPRQSAGRSSAGPGAGAGADRLTARDAVPQRLCDIASETHPRTSTGIDELDRVLGGGLVYGSLVLVGGDPGIGKSTLLLQAVANMARQGATTLYVTAEESPSQVKLRAARMGIDADALWLLAQTDMEAVEAARRQIKPDIMVIDSVQTVGCGELTSAVGSVAQVRAVTQKLMEAAKGDGVTTFVVGHVTKEGTIAGPKVMEHMVDTVLYFEGERTGPYRILRAHKNRFGSAQEIGVFEMMADGLHTVKNPSALFLSQRAEGPGSTVVTSLEGSRPILLEVQALVTPSFMGGTPRRNTTGFDPQRVAMLCAVLTARARIDLSASDVFVNVAGGVRVSEPAADLGVIMALASASARTAIGQQWVVVGEVGLAGEVRAAAQVAARLAEAASLGFTKALVPRAHADLQAPSGAKKSALTVHGVADILQALSACNLGPAAKRPRP